MSDTRLSQFGVGVQAYETPIDVELSTANWGWTAYPLDVDYDLLASSRLGQFAVGVAAYTTATDAETINLASGDWGWTAYNITVPGENFYLTRADWGWAAQSPVICGQDPSGYPYSFNSNVWPSCVYNAYKYGVRGAMVIELARADWGWQSFPATIDFEDPIDVDLTLGNWGWTSLPLGVSFAYDIGLQVSAWGWQPLNVTAELPYDIDLSAANWGWTSLPLGISYLYDVGLVTASWGWQSFPLTVWVPEFNFNLRRGNWGWRPFPIQVKQTTLNEDDIAAIAEAVWQKFVDEGAVQHMHETWQRQGCDPSYPQTYAPTSITVGGMTIDIDTKSGKTTQTRQ